MSSTITIRMEPELKARLDHLAATVHQSKSVLAAEAIRDYIDLNEWQLQETKMAIKEADAGDFVSDAVVAEMFRKWGADADQMANH